MRFLKGFLLVAGSLISILLVSGFIIGRFYEDEVKQYIITELNKNLKSPVKVGSVSLSVFEKFPYASLEFNNVEIKESFKDSHKNFLKANSIYLQFNVLDIFSKNYTIKKIDIHDADINIKYNNKNEDNFHFWMPTENNNTFSLALKNVKLQNVSVSILNEVNQLDINAIINDVSLKGNFSSVNYSMSVFGNCFIDNYNSGDVEYLRQRPLDLDLNLSVNSNNYDIKKGKFILAGLSFVVNGSVHKKESLTDINLSINAEELDIKSALTLLPSDISKIANEYDTKGIIDFKCVVTGTVSSSQKPEIKAEFGIEKGSITEPATGISFTKINLTGNYTNGIKHSPETNYINISDFTANLGEGRLKGKVSVNNFEHPYIKFTALGDLNCAQVKDFFKLDTLREFSGLANFNLNYEGPLPRNDKYTYEYFVKSKSEGTIEFKNTSLAFKGNDNIYSNINALLTVNNNDTEVKELTGEISGNDFQIKGVLENIWPFIFLENQRLTVTGIYSSQYTDLGKFISKSEGNKQTVNDFPDNIDFNLTTDIRQLVFNKFKCNNLQGKFSYQSKKLAANYLSFQTMDGEINLKGMLDATTPDILKVVCDAQVNKIDVSKLFYQLENFGQGYLKDTQIKGIATADIQVFGNWDNEMELISQSLIVKSDLEIDKGELKDFEPLFHLSKFIQLSELKHIKFATLKNTIEIKDQKIIMPKINISTNALNLTCSGTHSFDSKIDYHFKLLLNDLLAQKAQKNKKENEEFGIVEDDGLGKVTLFISMKGDISNPHVAYDGTQHKEKIKEDFIAEKRTLKGILKEEFGWFKKDSTLKAETKKQYKTPQVEWSENKQPQQKKTNEQKTEEGKKEKSKFGQKLDKLTKPNGDDKSTQNSDDFN